MQAFSNYTPEGSASWIYILFDHNEHELEKAKIHAQTLGFTFATRTGMRNSYHDWIAKISKKDKKIKKVVVQEKKITTTGSKEHSKKNDVKDLDKFISEYKMRKQTKNFETKKQEKDIMCLLRYHGTMAPWRHGQKCAWLRDGKW